MFQFSSLNPWAVLVATIAGFGLGSVWYGPLFGKAWLQALGKSVEELGKPGPAFALSFVAQLVTAIVQGLLVVALGLSTAADGALFGLMAGVGFVATSLGSDAAFTGGNVWLWAIQSGYRVTYLIIMGAILAAWR